MSLNIKTFREKVMWDTTLLHIDKCILFELYCFAGKNKTAFPSQETLAKNLGVSARYIRERLVVLKEKKLILSWERRGYSKSNLYKLNEELYFLNEKTERNSSSPQIGNTKPVQSGAEVPPNNSKDGIIKNGGSSTDYVLQSYELNFHKKLHFNSRKQLEELCKKYSTDLVIDAMKEAHSRDDLSFVSVKLISLILQDRERDGKPEPPPIKPLFSPCYKNGCENGYIYIKEKNASAECECRATYNATLEKWQNEHFK
ncbi:MAG TPA: helix-turn-helix domain-containing protein [Candidatus Sulfotelmatobacter sp.]|jgi:hypothetical protein|nr:helix-turn-helix domain-containing protein [Candidatus Sulfotelmatobacter sp.]